MTLDDMVKIAKPLGKHDWSTLTLGMLPDSIGPSDFEKEYLCDFGAGSTSTAISGAGTTVYGPTSTGAGTTASTGAGAAPTMSASELLKAMEAVIDPSIMKRIVEESIKEVETGQASAVKVTERRAHPDFGSW